MIKAKEMKAIYDSFEMVRCDQIIEREYKYGYLQFRSEIFC